MDFFDKLKGLLLEPSKTFEALKEDTVEDAVMYSIGVAVFSPILTSTISALLTAWLEDVGTIFVSSLLFFLSFLINGAILIVLFLIGVLLHVVQRIVGEKKGRFKTIKAVMYGSTPGLLLFNIMYPSFLVLINPIAWIWSILLVIKGLRQFREVAGK